MGCGAVLEAADQQAAGPPPLAGDGPHGGSRLPAPPHQLRRGGHGRSGLHLATRVRNRVAKGSQGVAFARAQINVTTPGEFRLTLNSSHALQFRVDDKPVTPAAQTRVSLTKGPHRLTFAIDLSQRKSGLRVELTPDGNNSARAEFVGGK